jgi:hypothetical protein
MPTQATDLKAKPVPANSQNQRKRNDGLSKLGSHNGKLVRAEGKVKPHRRVRRWCPLIKQVWLDMNWLRIVEPGRICISINEPLVA